MATHFKFEDVNKKQLHKISEVKRVLKTLAAKEKVKIGKLTYIFCSDAFILAINRSFLNHNFLTDIISFDYSLHREIAGEIYISTERVFENAQMLGVEFQDEIRRVIIHGMLHLCGYRDKTKRESEIMREMEDLYLNLFKRENQRVNNVVKSFLSSTRNTSTKTIKK